MIDLVEISGIPDMPNVMGIKDIIAIILSSSKYAPSALSESTGKRMFSFAKRIRKFLF